MTYEYNSLGKVTLEKGEKGRKTEVRSYEYAGTGAVTRMTDENTEVSYTYNSYGLPAAEKYKADGVCCMGFYTYDGRGNRKSFKLYQGKVTGFEKLDSDDVKLSMSYEYDAGNRMTAVRGYDWEG